MEGSQITQENQTVEQSENINEVQNKFAQQSDTQQADLLPNQTLYVNNLNEKIKNDGKFNLNKIFKNQLASKIFIYQ